MSPDAKEEILTVTDNLFAQGSIPENILSIALQPVIDGTSIGEITWGLCIYHFKPCK